MPFEYQTISKPIYVRPFENRHVRFSDPTVYLSFFVIKNEDVRAKGALQKVEQCWTRFWTNCHLTLTIDSVVAKFRDCFE